MKFCILRKELIIENDGKTDDGKADSSGNRIIRFAQTDRLHHVPSGHLFQSEREGDAER